MTQADNLHLLRTLGAAPGPDGHFMRFVNRHLIYGSCMDFRTFCTQILKNETKYLVLDLDGTFHRGLNLGVLLGWELSAYEAYGMDFLVSKEKSRGKSPLVLDWNSHSKRTHYATNGLRRWAGPGVLYYCLARLGWKQPLVRKQINKYLGTEAMDHLLALMRLGLMHQMAGKPNEDITWLVKSLWKRYADFLVIQPEDIHWLRKHYPEVTVIVSSASPEPCLCVVKEQYPVHKILHTQIETKQNCPSTPHLLHPIFGLHRPLRIAPPRTLNPNASFKKIDNLIREFPDFCDPEVHTVGITDTKHGEDHPWAHYFKCVADINSPDPFSPLISGNSPLTQVHSAQILTKREIKRQKNNGASYLDRKRNERQFEGVRELNARTIYKLASLELGSANDAAGTCKKVFEKQNEKIVHLKNTIASITREMETAVSLYNHGTEKEKSLSLSHLKKTLGQSLDLHSQIIASYSECATDLTKIQQCTQSAQARVHRVKM